MPAPHPPEFRQRAVELARAGEKPVAQLATDLGISESCLRNWMAQADVDDKGSSTTLTSSEKAELSRLRRHARQLEQENEILKRAALRTGGIPVLGCSVPSSLRHATHRRDTAAVDHTPNVSGQRGQPQPGVGPISVSKYKGTGQQWTYAAQPADRPS